MDIYERNEALRQEIRALINGKIDYEEKLMDKDKEIKRLGKALEEVINQAEFYSDAYSHDVCRIAQQALKEE